MQEELVRYFRCPESLAAFRLAGTLSSAAGFFNFGREVVCYGQSSVGSAAGRPDKALPDLAGNVRCEGGRVDLPFYPGQVVNNLRSERYVLPMLGGQGILRRAVRNAYYAARPLLPVFVRKHLQKAHLNGWRKLAFPRWPVDVTVEQLHKKLLQLAVRAGGGEAVPFIWFWPEGASACAVMTHDVETSRGIEQSAAILDMNDSFGVRASFQIVPEERYPVTEGYLRDLRQRGQEINIQGLNHDGHLFRDKDTFRRNASRINQYARQYGAVGFRSPVLYRNQEWFEFLEFQYDTSVPNVAHLDPQRGGCCTVMPYFVGHLVELPVTLTQDYSLFHILDDYSLDLWKQQIEIIVENHGLINAIVHPDYICGPREQEMYRGLLQIYLRLRDEQNVWLPLPREVNSWWRQRNQMKLAQNDGQWRVEGQGSERARVAFATLEDDRLVYSLAQPREDTFARTAACPHAPVQ